MRRGAAAPPSIIQRNPRMSGRRTFTYAQLSNLSEEERRQESVHPTQVQCTADRQTDGRTDRLARAAPAR